jgi:hypothetical protein
MQNPSSKKTSAHCPASTLLFRQAANDGRSTLNEAELQTLLAPLELDFDPDQVGPPPAVELRISLDNTREFGMVLSAGSGGLEAELAAGNFKQDRASVHAVTELTDATFFCFSSSVPWHIKN